MLARQTQVDIVPIPIAPAYFERVDAKPARLSDLHFSMADLGACCFDWMLSHRAALDVCIRLKA